MQSHEVYPGFCHGSMPIAAEVRVDIKKFNDFGYKKFQDAN